MDKRQKQRTSNGHRRKERDRLSRLLMIICVLLLMNIVFSLYLQMQIGSVRKTVDQAMQNRTDAQVSSGSLQNQQISSGGLQNSYDTVGSNDSLQTIGRGQSGSNQNGQEQGINKTSGFEEDVDYVELCGLPEVEKPVKRSAREVLARLSELAEDSEMIKSIYENASAYPDKMLEALANNPEMADYVAGYLEAEEKTSGERKTGGRFTEHEKEQEYPLFLQWDPRWGYEKYGEYSNVGLAGCGPTCLSMVMYYLLENEELTPDVIAKYSADNGYYIWGTGTAWALLEDYPAMYGVNVRQPGISEETMKAELDQGRFIICSMGQGDFTTAGHFIVIYGYDKDGFKVNDSNCVARSRKSWTYDEIGWQIKQLWSYGLGGSSGNVKAVENYGGYGDNNANRDSDTQGNNEVDGNNDARQNEVDENQDAQQNEGGSGNNESSGNGGNTDVDYWNNEGSVSSGNNGN